MTNYEKMWSDQKVADLINLSNQGLGPKEICKKLNVSRNAVCGKLHRIRIKNGHKTTPNLQSTRRYNMKKNIIGKMNCTVCGAQFGYESKFQRFCDTCKRSSLVRFG
jgi:hypothetical protein